MKLKSFANIYCFNPLAFYLTKYFVISRVVSYTNRQKFIYIKGERNFEENLLDMQSYYQLKYLFQLNKTSKHLIIFININSDDDYVNKLRVGDLTS